MSTICASVQFVHVHYQQLCLLWVICKWLCQLLPVVCTCSYVWFWHSVSLVHIAYSNLHVHVLTSYIIYRHDIFPTLCTCFCFFVFYTDFWFYFAHKKKSSKNFHRNLFKKHFVICTCRSAHFCLGSPFPPFLRLTTMPAMFLCVHIPYFLILLY